MHIASKHVATFGLICALCVTSNSVDGVAGNMKNGTEQGTRNKNTQAVRKDGWLTECKRELEYINEETVKQHSPYLLSEKYLNLLTNGDITQQDYEECIRSIARKFNGYSIPFDKDLYIHKGAYQSYIADLTSGRYNNLVDILKAERGLSVPSNKILTSSQALVLEMTRHTGVRWASGLGIANNEPLRYSQTKYTSYTSDITGDTFSIRPDCSGFVYTILRELGCDRVKYRHAGDGYNTQSLVDLCSSGELSLDPRIKVIPFNVNELKPGDIMVASVDERLTRWGTNTPYVNSEGNPIRKGHTEVFIEWASPEAEEAKTTMYVYSWGSTSQVNAQFVDADTYKPLLKNNPYNYTYIIRFIGGYDLWQ